MRQLILIALVASAYAGSIYDGPIEGVDFNVEPDANMNATQIIQRWGYPVEQYDVTTDDGYILQIQRIPHGLSGQPSNGKTVFLQHGLFSSSFDFLLNLPSESLGFYLADHGWDVWLGNVRGNTYGRRHVNLTVKDKAFWDFTFDEFIDHDVPNMIDFVLKKTGKDALHYVGHSQGTIVLFGLLGSKPEYQHKIKAFAALGPVANVTYVTSPARYIAPFSNDLGWIMKWLGSGEFLSSSPFMKFLARTMCVNVVTTALCEDVMFLTCGLDTKQLNTSRVAVYLSHTPAGTSVRNLVHYGQEIEAERFQKFDFGTSENKQRYGQATPPEYDVRNIHTPVGLYWADNDWLADPLDVDILRSRLPNLAVDYKVPEAAFTHLDFLLGIHANTLVYPNLTAFLDQY